MSLFRARRSAILALLASGVLAGQALAATWAPARPASPQHAWSGPGSLARTDAEPAPVLHMVYTTDWIDGVQASDGGPHQGVYYRRRAENGTTWSTPKRLSQPGKHADRGVIAAHGNLVEAMWQTFASYDHPDPTAVRKLHVRRSLDQGVTWGPISLFFYDGEATDAQSVTIVGTEMFVVKTSANDGGISIWSYDCDPGGGCGGIGVSIGTTANHGPEGLAGGAVVAGNAHDIAIAWIADDVGTIKARFGDIDFHFSPEATIATGARDTRAGIDIDMKGDRTVFTWSTGDAIKVRVRKGTTLGPPRTVATFSPGGTFKSGYLPAVQLLGAERIGVAWSECRRADCSTAAASVNGVDLAWRESTDNGVTWSTKATLANSTSNADRRRNEAPSIQWAGGSTRFVLSSSSSANRAVRRVFLQEGDGAP
jgi:hypothetical protein